MSFELVEYRDPVPEPGMTPVPTQERILGTFDNEVDAIATGREAWEAFRRSGSRDVAWWIVRAPDETLARWIADSASPVERVLDLRTGTLVPL